MRRHRKTWNPFIGMTLSSLVAFVVGLSLMRLFAELFGEMIAPSIPLMSAVLSIPAVTFFIGIVGWVWTEWERWQDF
jgi:hypothetical protein